MHSFILKNKYLLIFLCLFLGHQIVQKLLGFQIPIIDNYFDDVICIPVIIGIFQFQMRYFIKQKDFKLSLLDATIITFLVAIFFEEILPKWNDNFYRDNWDYLMYFIGFVLFIVSQNKSISKIKLQ